MLKYKIGQYFTTTCRPCEFEGCVFEIANIVDVSDFPYQVKLVKKGKGYAEVGYSTSWRDEGDMQIIKNKTITMKKLNNMMKKLLDADTQTLVKAGYINGDLELTCEGKDALFTLVFDGLKSDLVKLATEKIAEDEKDN